MIDLTTGWLGLTLDTPFVLAASPLTHDVEAVAAAVAAGAGAVIMHSLFEEQLIEDQMAAHRFVDARVDLDAEAASFLPGAELFSLDAEPYLEQLDRLRRRVHVPIIASLNGTTPGGWTDYARKLEAAGASAIELNLYDVATSPDEPGAEIENRQLAVVRAVTHAVQIPVTVKLSPFYTSVPAFLGRLEHAGARGAALFNRFYQPDIDLETLDVDRKLVFSTPRELPLRLHALAIVSPDTPLSLACTGGVHTGHDAAKAIVCGADVVQLASALLERGPDHLTGIRDQYQRWLAEKGYASSDEARGVLARNSAPDRHAWERVQYTRMLESWKPRRYGT
ncbi:MAG TPA: dihydroorotate dehydrogenase-like protein [Kofleriaceae bacterium]